MRLLAHRPSPRHLEPHLGVHHLVELEPILLLDGEVPGLLEAHALGPVRVKGLLLAPEEGPHRDLGPKGLVQQLGVVVVFAQQPSNLQLPPRQLLETSRLDPFDLLFGDLEGSDGVADLLLFWLLGQGRPLGLGHVALPLPLEGLAGLLELLPGVLLRVERLVQHRPLLLGHQQVGVPVREHPPPNLFGRRDGPLEFLVHPGDPAPLRLLVVRRHVRRVQVNCRVRRRRHAHHRPDGGGHGFPHVGQLFEDFLLAHKELPPRLPEPPQGLLGVLSLLEAHREDPRPVRELHLEGSDLPVDLQPALLPELGLVQGLVAQQLVIALLHLPLAAAALERRLVHQLLAHEQLPLEEPHRGPHLAQRLDEPRQLGLLLLGAHKVPLHRELRVLPEPTANRHVVLARRRRAHDQLERLLQDGDAGGAVQDGDLAVLVGRVDLLQLVRREAHHRGGRRRVLGSHVQAR
mmetsp:Transcript_66534/g.150216  ORF Transcript_66534/g.150216 Transcript_66534/m.150216 type:complete len:461 (-) Transcript_66534:474-1856(-)